MAGLEPGHGLQSTLRFRVPNTRLDRTKDLSGERHAHSHEKEKYSHDPGELAGKLISAEKGDLHHVNEDNGHP